MMASAIFALLTSIAALPVTGCGMHRAPTIAVIARTTGTMMSEPIHGGAESAARDSGAHIYWNAPTREDDVQGQIAMVEQVVARHDHGLVLHPDHALALISPVRAAIAHGIPTVVVGSPLEIPAGDGLFYVLNDEQRGGALAAARVAAVLRGHGHVALVGIDPDIAGVMARAREFEKSLKQLAPGIEVVASSLGSFNMLHEQQVAEETLRTHPALDLIVAFTGVSGRGALTALAGDGSRHVKVVVFDPDSTYFDDPNLDSLVLEDLPTMGSMALRVVLARLHGERVPATQLVEPLLATRENVSSAEVRRVTSMNWRTHPTRWIWSVGP